MLIKRKEKKITTRVKQKRITCEKNEKITRGDCLFLTCGDNKI